ncbi:MAG: hypothetical protein NZ480_07200 [Bdellovibrionaceae bacterium]|nr:hypothetical protein [Pseudobdellovibrionaceae bacterium]MDW8191294.1 hypothetical protein [Pseudobdellovibrionaceae bacterium]
MIKNKNYVMDLMGWAVIFQLMATYPTPTTANPENQRSFFNQIPDSWYPKLVFDEIMRHFSYFNSDHQIDQKFAFANKLVMEPDRLAIFLIELPIALKYQRDHLDTRNVEIFLLILYYFYSPYYQFRDYGYPDLTKEGIEKQLIDTFRILPKKLLKYALYFNGDHWPTPSEFGLAVLRAHNFIDLILSLIGQTQRHDLYSVVISLLSGYAFKPQWTVHNNDSDLVRLKPSFAKLSRDLVNDVVFNPTISVDERLDALAAYLQGASIPTKQTPQDLVPTNEMDRILTALGFFQLRNLPIATQQKMIEVINYSYINAGDLLNPSSDWSRQQIQQIIIHVLDPSRKEFVSENKDVLFALYQKMKYLLNEKSPLSTNEEQLLKPIIKNLISAMTLLKMDYEVKDFLKVLEQKGATNLLPSSNKKVTGTTNKASRSKSKSSKNIPTTCNKIFDT